MKMNFLSRIMIAAALSFSTMSAYAQTSNPTYGFENINTKEIKNTQDRETVNFLKQFWEVEPTEYDIPAPSYYYSSFQINGENYMISAYNINRSTCIPTINNSDASDPIICEGIVSKFVSGAWRSKKIEGLCLVPTYNDRKIDIVTTVTINQQTLIGTFNFPDYMTDQDECAKTVDLNF